MGTFIFMLANMNNRDNHLSDSNLNFRNAPSLLALHKRTFYSSVPQVRVGVEVVVVVAHGDDGDGGDVLAVDQLRVVVAVGALPRPRGEVARRLRPHDLAVPQAGRRLVAADVVGDCPPLEGLRHRSGRQVVVKGGCPPVPIRGFQI